MTLDQWNQLGRAIWSLISEVFEIIALILFVISVFADDLQGIIVFGIWLIFLAIKNKKV